MMILVLNSGSSSVKFQLFNMENEEVIAKGRVARIGEDTSRLKLQKGNDKIDREIKVNNHTGAIKLIKDYLLDGEKGVIESINEITAIGHRVVHGGEEISEPTIIDDEVEELIDDLSSLAPLHNPHNLTGIKVCKEVIPDTPQVAVFDTGFHQTLPETAYMYALPYKYYEKYKIRRYGFHGTSHKYVAQRAADLMNEPLDSLKIITLHLGNGASITAVKEGKSVDTSMGLTPLEGLVMGTRSGDIDPSLVPFLAENEGISSGEVEDILNNESGLLGVSGISNDFRELKQAADNDEKRAKLALKLFYYRIKKYIGAYMAAMGGTDAIVFTGGIGENEAPAREEIMEGLEYTGARLDKDANQVKGEEKEISAPDSTIKLFTIPTNEELVIARAAQELID
ncbi:MAG: acetate/propionate family kinase [Halanaerobiaceae bacterium]